MRVEDAEQAKCKPVQELFALIYLTLQKLGQKNTATLAQFLDINELHLQFKLFPQFVQKMVFLRS